MTPGSEHRSPIRTDHIAKNSTQGFVNKFLMGLSDTGHLQARRQNYAPQYHYVVGLSRCFPIYWGHKAPAKLVVENCQARQSKEASAASDHFSVAFAVGTATAKASASVVTSGSTPCSACSEAVCVQCRPGGPHKSRSWVTPCPPHDGVGSVVS